MAHFFGRFFKKTARKGTPSPAYFEALESRQLLSATYTNADVQGTWAVIGSSVAGSVVIKADGTVDAAAGNTAITNGGNAVADADLGFSFTTNTGAAAFTGQAGTLFGLDGTLASNKSVITLGAASSQSIMIKKGASYANADLVGKWSFATEDLQGSFEFVIKNNAVSIKSMTVKALTVGATKTTSANLDVKLADSTVTIDASGNVVITLKKGATTVKTLTGVMNNTKDAIGFSTAGNSQNEVDVGVAVKTGAATYAKTDLATGASGYNWSLSGDSANGILNIKADNKGVYNLSLATGQASAKIFGDTATAVSSKLSITSAGVVSGTISYTVGGTVKTAVVTGQMNASKNIINLYSTSKTGTLVLTTSADHASVNTDAGKTVNDGDAQKSKPVVLADFNAVLDAAGITDIDDINDITSVKITGLSGTLTVNGVVVTVETTLLRSDDFAVTWTAAPTAKGNTNVNAFKVKLDNNDKGTTVAYKRLSNVITIKPSTNTVVEDNTKSIVITLKREVKGETLDVSFDLSVNSAIAGTDYTIVDGNGADISGTKLVRFAANSDTTTITIKPIVIQNITLDRKLTLTLTTADNKAYDLAATKSVTATIKGNVLKTDTQVTVTASPSKATEGSANNAKGSYIDFTISRGTKTSGDLDLDFTVSGATAARYKLTYLNADGTTTDFGNGQTSVKILDTKSSRVVRLILIADSTGYVTETVSFGVTVQANKKDTYYVDGVKNVAKATLIDNETPLTVKPASTTISEGGQTKVTFTVGQASANPTTIDFALTGTAIDGTDYAVYDAAGTNLLVKNNGKYSVTIAANAKEASFVIKASIDKLRTEGKETVIVTVASQGAYTPQTPATITITDKANVAPEVKKADDAVAGREFVKNSSTGTLVTVAELISGAQATDLEDSTNLGIQITSIAKDVTLFVDGVQVKLTGANAFFKLGKDDVIVVKVATAYTAKDLTKAALFSFKALDSEGAVSSKAAAVTGKVVATGTDTTPPTDAAGTVATAIQISDATGVTLTGSAILTLVNAADATAPMSLLITSIATGVTLTIGSTTYTSASNLGTGIVVYGADSVIVKAVTGATVANSTKLFSVKVTDAVGNVTANAVDVSGEIDDDTTPPSVTAGTLTGSVAIEDATGITVTGADILTAVNATDLSGPMSLLITSIAAGVSLTFGGNTYTSASNLGAGQAVSAATSIQITATGAATVSASTKFFSVKVKDNASSPNITAAAVDVSGTIAADATAPKNAANGTVAGTVIVDDATGVDYTGAAIITATSATDTSTPMSLLITSIATGVTVKLGSTTYTSASDLGTGLAVLSTDTITVKAVNGATVANSTKLFSVKVVDAAGNKTASAVDISGKIGAANTAPGTISAGTIAVKTFKNDANTGTSVSVSDLVTTTGVTDDYTATASLEFNITQITAGVTLTIGGTDYTSVSDLTGVKISGVSTITVKNNLAVGVQALFSVSATDAGGLTSAAVVISGTVN